MGNACTPEQNNEESATVTDMEVKDEDLEAAQPSEKLTKIINTYQADNEKMKKEIESMRNKNEEETKARKEQAAQNVKVMNELSAMRAMLKERNRELVKHQLEAALHSKATSMVTTETVTKLLKAGNIAKFGRGGKLKPKDKWVEIHIHSAQSTSDGVKKGLLMLTYADSKEAQVSNRCQIVKVKQEELKVSEKLKDKAFSLEVISSGADKELVFACEDEKTKEEWLRLCNDGFVMVEEEFSTLKNVERDTVISVEFSKPKLGIRVEEKVLATVIATDDKSTEVSVNKAKADKSKEEANEENASDSIDQKEKPCELFVKKIQDEDLFASGLTEGCVILTINGINMRGLTYSEQVDMFTNTEKPFTITFLKKKSALQTDFPGILKELVSDEDNLVKSAFYDLVKGTPFGIELEKSKNKTVTITELLSSQRKLTAVLQNTITQEAEL